MAPRLSLVRRLACDFILMVVGIFVFNISMSIAQNMQIVGPGGLIDLTTLNLIQFNPSPPGQLREVRIWANTPASGPQAPPATMTNVANGEAWWRYEHADSRGKLLGSWLAGLPSASGQPDGYNDFCIRIDGLLDGQDRCFVSINPYGQHTYFVNDRYAAIYYDWGGHEMMKLLNLEHQPNVEGAALGLQLNALRKGDAQNSDNKEALILYARMEPGARPHDPPTGNLQLCARGPKGTPICFVTVEGLP